MVWFSTWSSTQQDWISVIKLKNIQAYPFIRFTLPSKSTGSYVGIINNHWFIYTQSQSYSLVHGLFDLVTPYTYTLNSQSIYSSCWFNIHITYRVVWKQGTWNWIHTQVFITTLRFNIALVWSVLPETENSCLHVVQSGSWFIRPG
jgi:hypothetical protein